VIICDHILPGKNGIEFLSELTGEEYFKFTRKILLTGQASHEDTINAINNANISHYFSKPWDTQSLQDNVRNVLTDYVIDTQDNLLPFMASLDAVKIGEALRNRSLTDN
jgi:response regulator RpfG family c-di-GMP phosphodiesterase